METIFDHNVTKQEIKDLFGFYKDKNFIVSFFNQQEHYENIYRLYCIREDMKTANKYARKLPNTIHKVFGLCNRDR